jgi:hypothetical protein
VSRWIRVLSSDIVEEGPTSGVNDPGHGVTEVGGYAAAAGLWVSRDYIIIIIIVEETSSTVRAERHRRWQSPKPSMARRVIIFTHQDHGGDVMSDSSAAAVLYTIRISVSAIREHIRMCQGIFSTKVSYRYNFNVVQCIIVNLPNRLWVR